MTRLENVRDKLLNNPLFEERLDDLGNKFGVFKSGKKFRKWFRRNSSKVRKFKKTIASIIDEFNLDKNIGWDLWIMDYFVSDKKWPVPYGRILTTKKGLVLSLEKNLTKAKLMELWPWIKENLEMYYGKRRDLRSKKYLNLERDRKFWMENKREGKPPRQIADEYSLKHKGGMGEPAVRAAIKRFEKMLKKQNA